MSLDVYLEMEGRKSQPSQKIFIREEGQTKEISQAEWDLRFPARDPVIVDSDEDTEVYSANITHNLGKMASEAGIYQHLWRPEELGIHKAKDLIEPLTEGLTLLRSDPARFKAFNPENGWGNYEGLVEFVDKYLNACIEFPNADVRIWR